MSRIDVIICPSKPSVKRVPTRPLKPILFCGAVPCRAMLVESAKMVERINRVPFQFQSMRMLFKTLSISCVMELCPVTFWLLSSVTYGESTKDGTIRFKPS